MEGGAFATPAFLRDVNLPSAHITLSVVLKVDPPDHPPNVVYISVDWGRCQARHLHVQGLEVGIPIVDAVDLFSVEDHALLASEVLLDNLQELLRVFQYTGTFEVRPNNRELSVYTIVRMAHNEELVTDALRFASGD